MNSQPNQNMGRKSDEVLPEGEEKRNIVGGILASRSRLCLIQRARVVTRLTSLPGFEAIADPRLGHDISRGAFVCL